MKKYIAAIDQGTTSTRCILFTHLGEVVASSQKEHSQIYPRPGWVEHDPIEILGNTKDVFSETILKSGAEKGDIAAIGITNQRETTVVWDKETGIPYYNAIVWQDTRTKQICDDLAHGGSSDRLREKTGLPLATYFSGPKIKWLIDHIENVNKGVKTGKALFGTIDTWIIWWLTGGPDGGSHVTDVTNASRTQLMNIEKLDWDEDILAMLGIPKFILPKIKPSSDSNSWGVYTINYPTNDSIPICGDVGDQQAALIGQSCFDKGDAKNTYGTGCFLLLNTGPQLIQSKSGLITTVGYKLGDADATYALEGSIAIAGALVQWLRDNIGLIRSSSEIEILANEVPDNGGAYFVPAFSGLFAPHWRSDARGVIVGLTRYINKGHIARAILEATAFQTREVLDAMIKDSGIQLKQLKVDGGMVYNELLMQFQADLLNIPVIRPKIPETTSLGAAYAAGLAVGYWDNINDVRKNWQMDKQWCPNMESEQREKLYTDWEKAVERSLNWL